MNSDFLDHSPYNIFLKRFIFIFKIISIENINLKIRFMRNYFFKFDISDLHLIWLTVL